MSSEWPVSGRENTGICESNGQSLARSSIQSDEPDGLLFGQNGHPTDTVQMAVTDPKQPPRKFQ
jgi:hypothetical protein